jgi:hypothetical protein
MLGLAGQDRHLRVSVLPSGDVASNFGRANDLAFDIPYWRDGERNINQTAVLSLANVS